VHLGSRKKEVNDYESTCLVGLGPSLWKVEGCCKVLASARDPKAALLTVGRRRGPDIGQLIYVRKDCSGGSEDGHHL